MGKLGELSAGEWNDLKSIFGELEKKYKSVLGAGVINIECNMNHAFKSEPYNPHTGIFIPDTKAPSK